MTQQILMPESLTAENGAKAALMGEFYENIKVTCPECNDDCEESEDCELCDGWGEINEKIMVSWTTIKEIYARAVKLLGQPVERKE